MNSKPLFNSTYNRLRALIAEDNASDRLLLKTVLTRLGVIDIHEAADGTDASLKIQDSVITGEHFHLVISDWNMPGKSGLNILSEIRSYEILNKTAVILVTATSINNDASLSSKIGAQDFILKPFNIGLLASKIEKVLQEIKL